MTAAELIATLSCLSDPDLEAVLEATRKERERRMAEARMKASLAEELDALAAALAERLDRIAAEENGLWSPGKDFVLALIVLLPQGRFPVAGLAGYRKTWPCDSRLLCSGQDKAACWPELLGVKPWDWPWQPLEPLTHDTRAAYVRGFVASFAPLERAELTPALHLEARAVPHSCSEVRSFRRSLYAAIERSAEGYVLREISWAAYRALCSRAAETLPELQQAQEKSKREAEAFAAKRRR